MKKEMLSPDEKTRTLGILRRIRTAMEAKGIETWVELNHYIEDKRGAAPQLNMYTKMQSKIKEDILYDMSLENLIVIADALDVSTDYLIGMPDKRTPSSNIEIRGLSEKAIKNLEKLSDSFDDNTRRFNKYQKNEAEKRMAALNWILEHVDLSDDTEDFLLEIYLYVMTNFTQFCGGNMELALNSIWTEKEYTVYHNNLKSIIVTGTDLDSRSLDKLNESRKNYVRAESYNRLLRRNRIEFLKDGIVDITDLVTYDRAKIHLGSPYDSIIRYIREILDKWREEYVPIYKALCKSQKADEKAFEKNTADVIWPGEPGFKIDPRSKKEEQARLMYRNPMLSDFSENDMKMYMMLEYLEKVGICFDGLGDDNELFISKDDSSQEELADLIREGEQAGVGIYIREDGSFAYSATHATPTTERLQAIFETKLLPSYLEIALNNPNLSIVGSAYYDKQKLNDYSVEQIADIKERFKKKGGTYKIKDNLVHIIWDKK